MARVNVDPLSGFRDFLPREMIFRQKVTDQVRHVFESYGFVPIDTPSMERPEVLAGKYGEESDNLIFRVMKRGDELARAFYDLHNSAKQGDFSVRSLGSLSDAALRYDLTVPLARLIAAYGDKLSMPFKRYHIASVWRADKPGVGRYRQFDQCDVDTVGSDNMLADAEFVQIIYETLRTVGFSEVVVRLNHRKILDALLEKAGVAEEKRPRALQLLDKLDKSSLPEIKRMMVEDGLGESPVNELLGFMETSNSGSVQAYDGLEAAEEYLSKTRSSQEGLNELREVVNLLKYTDVPSNCVRMDFSLARGLAYYTGMLYETVLPQIPQIGSVMSGGRFDNLIGMFLGRDIPAVGVSLGLDRLFSGMEKLGMIPQSQATAEVMVSVLSDAASRYGLEVARCLRQQGLKVLLYANPKARPGHQLGFANREGIDRVVIVGEVEMGGRFVTIKDMKSGTQKTIPLNRLSDESFGV